MSSYSARWAAALTEACAVCGGPKPEGMKPFSEFCGLPMTPGSVRNAHRYVPALAQPLPVYVPALGRDPVIHPGSGIVGQIQENGLLCYYQEVHGANSNIRTWADCCHHAAGRLIGRYPTSAFRVVEPRMMRQVGTYNGYRIELLDGPGNRELMARWLSFDVLERPRELERSE